MKISPMATAGQTTLNPNEGRSASQERVEKVKAALTGQPLTEQTPQTPLDGTSKAMKRIKMRTQLSQDRHMKPIEEAPATTAPAQTTAEPVTQSDPLDSIESTEAVPEETKPLSPQFAALAKQKRALQLKEQELLAKEKALETQPATQTGLEEYRSRLKSNALSVLLEEGVTYDQLTEQILAAGESGNQDLTAIQTQMKALEERLQNQDKSLQDRDAAAKKQVMAQLNREAEQLVSQGDDYEMIREWGYQSKIVELIDRTFDKTGEFLDVAEAATAIEAELLETSLRAARIKKVQSKLTPTEALQQTQPVQSDRGNFKTMRTLTNRDGATSHSMSKRERAIAAMEGRLLK